MKIDQLWIDWCLKGGTRFLMASKYVACTHHVASLPWLSSKAQKEWNVGKPYARWWKML